MVCGVFKNCLVGVVLCLLTGCGNVISETLVLESADVDRVKNCVEDGSCYRSEKFKFSVPILPDFKVEYLPEEEGIVMRRTISGEELKKQYEKDMEIWPVSTKEKPIDYPYSLEIGVLASENFLDYADLGAYMKSECADCNKEFMGNGVFLDLDMKNHAERLYLMMSDNGKILYRAYVKAPGSRLQYYNQDFVKLIQKMEVF